MTTYTLFLGLITRDNHPVKPSARNAVLDDAAKTFGGYTATNAIGGWVDNGFTIQEPSLRIEVITDASHETVRQWAERARLLANQDTVILTSRPIDVEFISEHSEHETINPVFDIGTSSPIGGRVS